MSEDKIYTAAVHAGEDSSQYLGSLSIPIYQSSIFAFPSVEHGSAIRKGEQAGYFYGRLGNPTQSALESALSELEGGPAALTVASGMAAISSLLLTLLRPGDHIIVPKSFYSTAKSLFAELLVPFGISVSHIEATESANFEREIRPETKAFYIESPANPTMKLIDLQSVAQIARPKGIITVIDNTLASPFNQQPLNYGIDIVIHSATKYLGGHADLIAGAIIGPENVIERARWYTNRFLGSVIAPQTAWLVLRGIRTLAIRMERHNSNALAVAQYLESQPKVTQVHYPGLASHPQHDLALRQMHGFGGVLAFDVGDLERGRRLVNNVHLCSRAVSFGDVATLISHPASISHASILPEQRLSSGITDGLVRLSVGIERVEDIIADLDHAFKFI